MIRRTSSWQALPRKRDSESTRMQKWLQSWRDYQQTELRKQTSEDEGVEHGSGVTGYENVLLDFHQKLVKGNLEEITRIPTQLPKEILGVESSFRAAAFKQCRSQP